MRRPVLGLVAGAVIAVVLVGVPAGAGADPVSDRKKALDKEIAQLRDELEGTSAEFAEAAVALKRAEAELADVRTQLTTAQEAVESARRRDAEVASRLAYARAEETKAERELRSQRAAEARARATIELIARQSYVDGGLTGLATALQTDDPDRFVDQLAFAGTALQSQTGAVRRLATQEAELRARGARLAAVRAEVADLKARSEAAVRERQEAEAEAVRAEREQARLVAERSSAVAVIKARADSEKARLDQLRAEQDRLQAELAERAAREARKHPGSAPPPSSSPGLLGRPVLAPVTSPFGLRYHPVLHIWRMHTGIDYGVGCGTPVRASAAGRVVSAGTAGGYGYRVVVDHGWIAGADLATTYNHLSRIVVRSGTVSRGQIVAYSGTTGLSTGCHLHFEVLSNGRYVNPTRYV
jgi:murein DD-endopeptidase MepM/ murein hydrolase activator NlpD